MLLEIEYFFRRFVSISHVFLCKYKLEFTPN